MVSLLSEVKAKFEEPGASSRWSDLKVYSAGQIFDRRYFYIVWNQKNNKANTNPEAFRKVFSQ